MLQRKSLCMRGIGGNSTMETGRLFRNSFVLG